jgi:glycosyltransferase involved in cell wall biosynthesis
MKPKLLCVLHRSPPAHGAAKVGDMIAESKALQEEFDCKFITIKSASSLEDIRKFKFKKIYFMLALYFKVLIALISFRPQKLYFTASVSGLPFYRDLFVSTLWKTYKLLAPLEVYYHYHTKGVNQFVSNSNVNLKLSRFFLKDINLVLLSPLLKDDFSKVLTYKELLFLPNGVEDNYTTEEFQEYIEKKSFETINILYLSNMMKSKGYFEVLKLSNETRNESIHYHFAGGWQSADEEKEFFDYIEKNNLSSKVTFHGFVNGEQKQELFEKSHFFVFPTRYENEAFPLSILEAFSYGLPTISTDEGSIPFIVDEKSGIVIDNTNKLVEALASAKETLLNKETALYCRQRYLENFNFESFHLNLVNIFRSTK